MDFWILLAIYIFFMLIMSFFVNEKKRKIIYFVELFSLTIISGFRSEIGEDYSGYVGLFFNCDVTENVLVYPEYSFQLLVTIIKYIGLDYQVLFLIYSILISICIYYISLAFFDAWLYRIIFISIWAIAPFDMGYWYSMNVIRQYLSIAIITLVYCKDNTNRIKLFGIILAGIIHTSAFIAVAMIFMFKENIRKFSCVLIVMIGVIFSFTSWHSSFMSNIISYVGIYESYVDFVSNNTSGLGVSNYVFLMLWAALMLFLNIHNNKDELLITFITLATALRFILIVPYVRVSAFFSMAFILAIVYLMNKIDIRKCILACLVIFTIFSSMYVYMINNTVHGHSTDWRKSAGNIVYEYNFKIIR